MDFGPRPRFLRFERTVEHHFYRHPAGKGQVFSTAQKNLGDSGRSAGPGSDRHAFAAASDVFNGRARACVLGHCTRVFALCGVTADRRFSISFCDTTDAIQAPEDRKRQTAGQDERMEVDRQLCLPRNSSGTRCVYGSAANLAAHWDYDFITYGDRKNRLCIDSVTGFGVLGGNLVNQAHRDNGVFGYDKRRLDLGLIGDDEFSRALFDRAQKRQ
jgi:hypothetical protein